VSRAGDDRVSKLQKDAPLAREAFRDPLDGVACAHLRNGLRYLRTSQKHDSGIVSRPRFTGHFCGERDDHATST